MSQAFFQKPLIKGPLLQLVSKVGYRGADMHFHTQYSMDGVSRIESVLEKCKKNGIGVAITDHNEIKGAVRAVKEGQGLLIIPGIELTCHRGVHLILYFYKVNELKRFYQKEIVPRKKKNPFFLPIKIEKMLAVAREYNCVTCIPHPFGPGVIGVMKEVKVTKELLLKIDLIEGINGACLKHENKKAVVWAKEVKKGMTAGTDGHTTPQLGKVLCFSYGKTVKSFLDSLKKGKSTCVGTRENMFGEIIHTMEKFITETRHERGKLLELYEARYKTEHDYLLQKLKKKKGYFSHHFHIHHAELEQKHKEFMKGHQHYKHIVKKR
ncbi:MAG: PHP domain-containing protein [Candidatus Woesearchaeota archaeon]